MVLTLFHSFLKILPDKKHFPATDFKKRNPKLPLSIHCFTTCQHSTSDSTDCVLGMSLDHPLRVDSEPSFQASQVTAKLVCDLFSWLSLSCFDSGLFGLGILKYWEGWLTIFLWIMLYMLRVTKQWCLRNFICQGKQQHLGLMSQASYNTTLHQLLQTIIYYVVLITN